MGTKWTLKDLTGQRFGHLTVLRLDPVRDSQGGARWVTRCDCGAIRTVRSTHLLHRKAREMSCFPCSVERSRLKTFNRSIFVAHMFTRYARGAKVRNVPFSLTHEQLGELLLGNCFYCGSEPRQYNRTFRGNLGAFPYNGIDRLANNLGYFFENCVSCCGTCNIAKQDMSVHAFVSWASKLAGNLQNAA